MPKKQTKYQKLVELGRKAVEGMEAAGAAEEKAIVAGDRRAAEEYRADWLIHIGKKYAYASAALFLFDVYSAEFYKQIGYKEV